MSDLAHRPGPSRPDAGFRGTATDLRALRAELEQQRRFRVEQLSSLPTLAQADDPVRADDPQGEVTLALRAAATAVLADIDDALLRIRSDRYGLCQRCGTAIPLERLQALPMTRRCRRCQRVQEATSSLSGESRPRRKTRAAPDIVDEWGHGSFPASDPPANW